MKIFLAGYFGAFWHEKAWSRALHELGHEVVEFPMSPYLRGGLWRRFQNRFVWGPAINKINRDFTLSVKKSSPDIVLCYRALPLQAQSIRELLNQKIDQKRTLVCYNNDNIFAVLRDKSYWRLFKKAIPFYDLHLVFRESDLTHLGPNLTTRTLYSYYLPWLHRPLPKQTLSDWQSDICFLGHCEPDRRLNELDTLMRRVPGKYRVHGSLWKKHSKGRAWEKMKTHEVQGEEYVKGINGAKIALAFFSTWNADMYTQRVFEIPACGTLMLAQRTETMLELYEEDKEAVYFSDADELVDKARFYLTHGQERERIAVAGRERCLRSGYDIHSRMREWLAVVETLRTERCSL